MREGMRGNGIRRRLAAAVIVLTCAICAACKEPAAGQQTDLSFLSPDTLLYGRPGADLGKGPGPLLASQIFPAGAEGRIPETFSWTDFGRKPEVRSQGKLGTCWALTAAEAVESALLPAGRTVFSADHISLQNGFDISQDQGGDYSMIMSYMADLKGPVTEKEDPYGDGISPEGLSPAARVREMRLLSGMSRARIKETIYRYGPVQSSLAMDRTKTDPDRCPCYNEKACAYRDPVTEELDHDILVLGWDDRFPKENFKVRPKSGGAWICQNTWGESFGQDGIFYVSYEDANLFRKGGIAYTDVEQPAPEHVRVYETDSLGWQARQGFGKESVWFAGVFSAEKDGVIKETGIYAVGPATTYEIDLVREPDFSFGPDTVPGSLEPLAAGALENPGFYTIPSAFGRSVKAGERFAVLVHVTTPKAGKPVAVEMRKDSFTAPVTLEGRESYISKDGRTWERTQTVYGTNVCLKVYVEEEQTWQVR